MSSHRRGFRDLRGRRVAGVVRAIALLMLLGHVVPAGAGADMEYRVKAAMLFNFAHYITWPEAPRGQLRLCVIGDFPATALNEIDAAETASWNLEVRRDPAPATLAQCHMLFVSDFSRLDLAATLPRLSSSPVVTVSDANGFAEQGGMVEFVLIDGKVRFDINLEAVESAGLAFSSKLLRLARRVMGGN